MIITIGIIDRDQDSREQLIAIAEDAMPDPIVREKPDLLIGFAKESFDPASIHPDECQPDIILIDIQGQEPGSVRRIKSHYPQSQVIVISETTDIATVLNAYRDGAENYVEKSTVRQFLNYAVVSLLKTTSSDNYRQYPQFTKNQNN